MNRTLRLAIVQMWLKNEGPKSRRCEVIALTVQANLISVAR